MLNSLYATSTSLFDKFIVNNSETYTIGGDNTTTSLNTNPMSTMDTSTTTTSTLIPNVVVNNASLSTGEGGGGGYWTVSHNKNMMATSTDMDDDNLYILIDDSFKAPRYDPGPRMKKYLSHLRF